MTTPRRTPRAELVSWVTAVGPLAIALFITLLHSVVTATILVDQIPGGDAGLATTPALESAYRTMSWSFPAFVGVTVIGVVVPLVAQRRTRRGTGSR